MINSKTEMALNNYNKNIIRYITCQNEPLKQAVQTSRLFDLNFFPLKGNENVLKGYQVEATTICSFCSNMTGACYHT